MGLRALLAAHRVALDLHFSYCFFFFYSSAPLDTMILDGLEPQENKNGQIGLQ